MNRKIDFYNQVVRNGRLNLTTVRNQNDALSAALYINRACDLALNFELDDFPVTRLSEQPRDIVPNYVMEPLYLLEDFLNKIYAENFYALEPNHGGSYISLDDDWKSKATTYVSHVRDIIQKADISVELKEAVLKSVEQLQTEINRERTRLDAAVNTMLKIIDAISKGAENLEPAVKLIKKIRDAFAGLYQAEEGREKPKLPAPEKLGLPDLSEDKD